ncbi:MAG TPA: lectin like domain-containing protein [Candidatus Bathyarchaeia archaeon]|nr:lectin like domain-containing protein [Candidatus Bathyarchaeia archaeon]
MTHRKLAAILLTALIALSVCGAVIHQSSYVTASPINATSTPNIWSKAPINPAFIQYLKDRAAGKATTTVNGHEVSIVPSTVNFSALTGHSAGAAAVPLAGSSSYDLRALGKVSPVGNQGASPACWAFAAYGSLESYLLPGTLWNFSENNMKNLAGFDLTCNQGGSQQMATAYLARWGGSMQSGPVTAACDPFNQGSCADTSLCSVQQHVQNVLFLPYRANANDNNNIKSALQTYGGVYAVMYAATGSYNPNTAAYYYNGSIVPNHAVTIVGWNDSYPASNFASRPPGAGAFIVKNSWGTGWGQQGFFYVSYYDTQFATNSQPPTVFTAEPTTNYNVNYQYDPLGWVASVGRPNTIFPSNTAWGANVFTATSNQQLSAVSFYAGALNTQYQVYVYTDPTSGPIGGTEYTGPSGTTAMAGYHTIPLNTTVPLKAGHQFSVVVKITTPGNNAPIPVESTQAGFSSATGQPGQGYLSATGTSWTDATHVEANMSICIKAFAKTAAQVSFAGGPAVSAQNANSLDLFMRGSDNAVWYKYWTGTTWTALTSLSGNVTSDPAATSRADGYMDVFARGTDGALWWKTTTNNGTSWSNWNKAGGQLASGTGAAADARGPNSLDAFVQGTDQALWYSHWDGTKWSAWKSLGGTLTSSPAATSRSSSTIDVFVFGSSNGLWRNTYTGGWSGWQAAGGT